MSSPLMLLEQALASPYGIAVWLSNPERLKLLRQKLYRVRKSNEKYNVLSFTLHTTEEKEELWIMRTDINV